MFEDADNFVAYYMMLAQYDNLYLSHMIYAMLLDGYVFRPFIADEYNDFDI